MKIRPVQPDDQAALIAFFHRMPEADRTFFKEDVDDPDVVTNWARPGAARMLAMEDGEVVGSVAVVPLHGWSSHVGEVRLVVDPGHRGRGLGRSLARQAVLDSVDMDLRKLVVDVIAEQESLIGMFRTLGFEPEALLVDHVRDRSGELRDLLVLANSVESEFASMSAAGIVESP